MGRRGANEGSVYKEKSTGRWRVAVRVPGGKIKRMNVASQAEGIRKLRAYRMPRAGGEATVSQYAKAWITEDQQARLELGDITAETLAWKGRMLDYYVVPALGRKRLSELRVLDVTEMLKGLASDGLAHRTIKGVRGVLCQMLDRAVAEERVERNVAEASTMPAGIQASGQKRESMTLVQAKALLAAVKGHRLEALFVTALMLGLRPGELLGLRWADVDLDAATIRISGSLRNDGTIGPPKTEASTATLDAPAPVVEALRAHKAIQAAERLRWKCWVDHGIVFASRRGTPTSHSTLRRLNEQICAAADLGKWTPHEWRHTAASLLLDYGVSREDAARILRHTNTRMLDEVYGHPLRPSIDSAVAPMESMFGGAR